MTTKISYTVCRYYPDFYKAAEVYPFAVVAATETEVALVGVNLSNFGLTAKNTLSKAVIERTVEMLWGRLEPLFEGDDVDDGKKVLFRFVQDDQSNIQYLHPCECEAAGDVFAAAAEILAREVGASEASSPESSRAGATPTEQRTPANRMTSDSNPHRPERIQYQRINGHGKWHISHNAEISWGMRMDARQAAPESSRAD